MTETEFKRLAAEGFNRVPLVLETFADLGPALAAHGLSGEIGQVTASAVAAAFGEEDR